MPGIAGGGISGGGGGGGRLIIVQNGKNKHRIGANIKIGFFLVLIFGGECFKLEGIIIINRNVCQFDLIRLNVWLLQIRSVQTYLMTAEDN